MQEGTIKAVAFDVDGTLLEFTLWPVLHALFNFPLEEDKRLHTLYHEGKLGYREWMQHVYGVYVQNGPQRTKDEVDAIFKNFKLVPHVREVMDALRGKYPLALVSSSLMDYVGLVAKELQIPHAYTFTHMTYDENGIYTGIGYSSEGNELESKVEALKDFGKKVGVEPHEIAFVGDSINDVAAFAYTGRGILIGESNEAARKAAWKRITAISEVLDIL